MKGKKLILWILLLVVLSSFAFALDITSENPNSSLEINITQIEEINLSVTLSDPYSNATKIWYVDGVDVGTGLTYTFGSIFTDIDTYNISFIATDGETTDQAEWIINFQEASPQDGYFNIAFILGSGIIIFALLLLSFFLDKEHIFLKLLLSFFCFFIFMIIGKYVLIMLSNSIYEATAFLFMKVTLWLFRLVIVYIMFYYTVKLFNWLKEIVPK